MCAFAGTDRPTLLERARGALLGAAVGDALGGPVEFMSQGEIAATRGVHKEMTGGGWLGLKPGQITDDTEMSLCVARALAADRTLNPRTVAENFARWYKVKPIDIGATCQRGIENYLRTGSLEVAPNPHHAGNGALMRVGPVAVASFNAPEFLAPWTLAQAHLTHNNHLSDAACLITCQLVQAALAGEGRGGLHALAREFSADNGEFTFAPYNGKASGYVVETLATVLHFFLTTTSFEACLKATVNQGGDADTNGAVSGLLAGAHYGLGGIPRRWLGKLDEGVRTELNLLAEQLIGIGEKP